MVMFRIAYRLSGFLLALVFLVPLQVPLMLVPRAWPYVPIVFHRYMMRIMGVKLHLTGPMPQRGTLIVANHLSWFDIIVIGGLTPLSFVAKAEVKSWPLFGQLAMLQRTVFVDRRRGRHNKTDANVLAKRLRKKQAVVIFAEGTNSDGIKVLKFKSTLLAGIEGQVDVPVQALTMAYRRAHNMAMGRRQRMAYAWLGDIPLLPHLMFMLAAPPSTVELTFHHPLPDYLKIDRKTMARALHWQVSQGLQDMTKGRPQALSVASEELVKARPAARPLVETAEKV
jgi:1-acyl-sn-glycerol-3-phosphate acyltransferase